MSFRKWVCVLAFVLLALGAFAQASTGMLTGRVESGGDVLPGVTVTVTSPALQGSRVEVTGTNGVFHFPALPPGRYTVVFELAGMDAVTKMVDVNLSQTAKVNAELGMQVAEAITVTAAAPTTLETSSVSQNMQAKQIDNLPINRTILGTASLAPGVSDEGPNNQLQISGAPSYENLYLVNGAVVNDSIRGQPESVFIEDAIQESTVLTGNISAEYGRFTGGVVNTLTKSGGNVFSGSIRDSLTNDDWTGKTPFAGEADPADELNEVYEATIGGYAIRDRLWFFGAGRLAETTGVDETVATSIPFDTGREEDRYEIKLTGQITGNHSVVGSYLDRNTVETGNVFGSVTDLRSVDDRELPNTLASVSYSGIITDNFLVEAQYSERDFAFVGSGADDQSLIGGTIIRDIPRSYRAWSPTFCGVCSDKTRNNEYLHLKTSYFLSTGDLGVHNLVAGFEDFSELRNENNEQGGSGYRVWGNFRFVGDETFLHVDPRASYIQAWPVLEESLTSDSNVRSIYLNDRWNFSDNLTFNLGVRYDENNSVDQAGNATSNDSNISPRLSGTWDVRGDGRHRITAGYGKYVAEIDNGINDESSSAGSPSLFSWNYRGPEINAPGTPDSELIPTQQVLEMVYEWLFNQNCPGTDERSVFACNENVRSISLPGVSTRIEGELVSPNADEFTLGYGTAVGRGFVRADYVYREFSDFYTATTNLANGTVTNDLGQTFDLELIQNNDTGYSREYNSIQLQGGYNFTDRINFGGNYTWSELEGNAITEASNSATDPLTSINSFPEYVDFSWFAPVRYLPGDVRHRANLWLSWDLSSPVGDFNFSILERYHSGFPYYANGTIDLRDIPDPGYQQVPATATYYFEGNKDYRTDDITRTDLGINYGLPIGSIELFVQADVLNVFDESGVEDPSWVDSTVLSWRNSSCRQADGTTRCERFNPMTTTAVEGLHYQKVSSFGEPLNKDAYQLPLTYRFSLGLRF